MKKLALSLAIVAFFAFGTAGFTSVVANPVSTEVASPDEAKKDEKKAKGDECAPKEAKSECCSSKTAKSGCGDKKAKSPEKI